MCVGEQGRLDIAQVRDAGVCETGAGILLKVAKADSVLGVRLPDSFCRLSSLLAL